MLKFFTTFWKLYFSYVAGITIYVRYNNTGKEKEDVWQSVKEEWKEFCDEIKMFNFIEAFLELCDVIHVVIKYLLVEYLPQWFYCSYICWILVFPLVLPCTLKLGYRHKLYNCIRNHKNPNNCKHKCNFKYPLLKEILEH